MVKLGSTLESSRKDGRLANSDNIYDKISGKMQEEINQEVSALSPVDEEDLTRLIDNDGRSVTKFADRSYSPQNFSGKGYKILRKNIKPVSLAITEIVVSSVPTSDGYLTFIINGVESHVDVVTSTDTTTDKVAEKIATKLKDTMPEYDVSKSASTITLIRKFGGIVSTPSSFSAVGTGVSCSVEDSSKIELRNLLTAVMLSDANTIYYIRYNFDLGGETIAMKEGCTLKFCGGTLKNGTINCSNTIVDSKPINILDNVILQGSIIGDVIINWFNHSLDCVESMYNLLCAIKIVGKYTIDKPLIVKTGFNIYGESMYKSRLILNKEYNEGVKTIFHFTNSKESINYISFRDFAVTSEDYVFYRNCVDISFGSSIQVGDFKNLYFDSIKKAIFSIKCYGFGCINLNNVYAIGDSDCSQPLFNFTNYWWNNNNIEKCRFNAKCKGLLSIVCSNTGEINRNSINGNWIELNTLSNSNDLIRMESDGVIYQFDFKENYIERNFMSDGSNINILSLKQPEGDYVIRQIDISNNTFISKYKSIITATTGINGIVISNNIFSETPVINNNKYLLDLFEYSNNKEITYKGTSLVNNNKLDNFKSVEDKASTLYTTIAKFGFGYANEVIKANETKIVSLIPANFNKRIYYSDVFIYNTTGSFIAEGRIIQKANSSRKFVSINKTGSDAESIVVDDSSGNISITNNTSNTIEVVCSSILRSLS